MEPDEAIMMRVQAGDEEALETLVRRHRARLYGFLHRRAGEAAADDLFQETWIRIVRARDRFDPARRFTTWMFQIANNLCRDRARRRAVEGRARETLSSWARSQPVAAAAPPLAERLDLEARIDGLPDRLREVLVLRVLQEVPEAEVAELLGIPRGTVKSRLHHAMKALRAFGEDGT